MYNSVAFWASALTALWSRLVGKVTRDFEQNIFCREGCGAVTYFLHTVYSVSGVLITIKYQLIVIIEHYSIGTCRPNASYVLRSMNGLVALMPGREPSGSLQAHPRVSRRTPCSAVVCRCYTYTMSPDATC